MLKISVEHRSALSIYRTTVEITLDERGGGRVATWEGSAFLPRAGAAPQWQRPLAESEATQVRASVEALQLRLGPLPDHSEMYDGWTTMLVVQDTYTTFSLRWFCAAPPAWRSVEAFAKAVQAAVGEAFTWQPRDASVEAQDVMT